MTRIHDLLNSKILYKHPTNSSMYFCVCNSCINVNSVSSHLKTKKHVKYIESVNSLRPPISYKILLSNILVPDTRQDKEKLFDDLDIRLHKLKTTKNDYNHIVDFVDEDDFQ